MTLISISSDLRLAYGKAGSGMPIVFIHGTAGDRGHWYKVIAELADMHMPVCAITPELYGYGKSPAWPMDRDVTVDDHVRAVRDVLATLLDGPAVIVGHSMGGAIALQLALDYPEMVSHLILAEPAAFHMLRTGDLADEALLEDLARVGRQLASGGKQDDPVVSHLATGQFVDYWNGAGTWVSLPVAVKTEMTLRLPSIGSDFTALYGANVAAERYAELGMPVLVIRGGRSPQPTRRIAEILVSAIPQASLVEIADAGHMLPLSHAKELAVYIREELVLERA